MTYMHRTSAARKLLERIEDLRVFPPAAGRVLYVAQNPASSLRDMEDAVGTDPVLAAKVVELSNSAMYGREHRVDTLARAIQVLGFDTTRDTAIALALSVIGQQADARWAHLWQHATRSARAARHLAPFVAPAIGRSAFLCSLLHDIGRQLMAVIDPDGLERVVASEAAGHTDVAGLERAVFGIDHASLSAACLELWNFRDELVDAVAKHHLPLGQLMDPDERQRVALLQLADALALGVAASDRVEGVLVYASHEPARRVLGLVHDDLVGIAAQLLGEEESDQAAA